MKKITKYIIEILLILISIIIYFIYNKENKLSNIYDSLVYIESQDNLEIINGSGFVYKVNNNKAYIVTNYHVVSDNNKIYVYNVLKEKKEASLLGYDEVNDIAIITIQNNSNLKSANIGNSDKVKLGDNIYAAGTPISSNYIGTITKGIVSFVNREITLKKGNTYKTIQFDAPISKGNSGGPLLSQGGNVIGMIFVKESNIEGVSFALPINFVMDCIKKIENKY